MTKMPKKVRVLSATYTFMLARNAVDVDFIGEDWGRTSHLRGVIILKDGQTGSVLRDTVLHEVLHCVYFQTNMASKPPEDEESFVRAITGVLLDTMRRNRALFSWLSVP